MQSKLLVLVAIATMFLPSCGGNADQPVEVRAVKFDEITVAGKVMKAYDRTGKGTLDTSDVADVTSLAAAFGAIDTDGSKSISMDELISRFKRYQTSEGNSVPVTVWVTLDGSPLANAKLTLEPEAFLADVLKTATGVTDDTGRCAEYALDSGKFNGVPAGLYRIKVESESTPIPAKYNAATTLGWEVVADGRSSEVAIRLTLTSK